MTKHEAKLMLFAIQSAISVEQDFIQGHKTGYGMRDGKVVEVVPSCHRSIVSKTNRLIERLRKLFVKIRAENPGV